MAATLLSDFMPVPIELKGYVIGWRRAGINEMAKLSGAIIDPGKRYQAGFTIIGSKGAIEMAKQLISKKLAELNDDWNEPVEIPDRYKGRVIGIGKANLRKIEIQTGVRLSLKEQEIVIVHGTKQQRRHAKISIGTIVAVARVVDFENKLCSYVDGCHLPVKCKLKLEEAETENPILLPGSETQYRLKPVEHRERKDSYHSWNNPVYQSNLLDEVLMSLRKIKDNMDSAENPKGDMWCYLGTCIIRAPDEDGVLQQTWEIEEITEKFQRPHAGGNVWKVSFTGRDDIPGDIFQKNGYKEITKGDEYISRYDLTYLTPCFYHLRCMVWVAKSSLKGRIEDVPIPGEVNNILEEIYFEDEMTRTRCRGWLVLKSRRLLQRDILFPGCELDCRFIMHERRHYAVESEDVPKIEVRRTLSTYLSRLTLTDEDAFGLRLPDHHIPDGFHLVFMRCCKRKMYSSRPEFSATLSQVNAWWIDSSGNETNRDSTELHLHSEECEKLFSSADWQPEIIVQKLPAFLEFVREVRGFVEREMKENGSTRTVPPEIRARGSLALEAYNNALAEGQTCVKRVPLMIVGQDRSGKTSLKKSLKGICFNPDEDSTEAIDVDTYHFKVTTGIWMTGKKDQDGIVDERLISFEHNVARWIADKLMAEENVADVTGRGIIMSEHYDDFEETNTLEERYPSETTSYTDTSESSTNLAYIHASHGEPPLTNVEEHDLTPTKYEEDILNTTSGKVPEFEDIAKLIQKILQDDLEDDREDIHSIMWDFAGQSVYYVTHPIFLTRRAIYFLVYDLSRNPSDKAIPLVKQGVYREIEDKSNLKTNMDYLEFWMSSLASLVEPNNCPYVSPEVEVLPKKLPAVFLVCTHADKPYCNRNPSALAREIFGNLKTKPYGAQLCDVFCVDNTKSGTESECREIMRLRENVHEIAKELPHVNEAIPIKWLKYENALRVIKENDRKFITLATATRIASNVCKINKNNEISTLLNFLHDLRVLIHFDDTPELSDLVILDPQWLIDVFKNVITVKAYHSNEKNFADLWFKLETEGILEEKLLKHVWNSLIPQTETHKSLIAIMEKFSLLCPWPTSPDPCNKHYLVPSMLQTHPPKMISNLVESAQLPSLFLKFDAGHVPPGLFPRFVLEFFLWGRKKFPRLAPPQFYNNFARFHIFPNQGLSIVFLCHSSAIEVIVLSVNNEIDTFDMASIRAFRDQLTFMLDRIWNKFFWVENFGYKVCFLCPTCSHGRVVSFCTQHREENCKQEKCLHFISESDLANETLQVFCTRSATARDNRIQAERFAPWISTSVEKQVMTSQRDERPILKDGAEEMSTELLSEAVTSLQLHPLTSTEEERMLVPSAAGSGDKSLVLPPEVSESLQLTLDSPKEVVDKLLHNLDDASLEHPKPETEKWIRCLTRNAKDHRRTEVVEYLRKIVPAGTTGPKLRETRLVQDIPESRLMELTITLSGRDDWETFAEKLGLTPAEIRFLDKRTKNQVLEVLRYVAQKYPITVGDLYDVLKDCGMPVVADLL